MSSQPSTLDSLRQTASSATQNIADGINPTKNGQGNGADRGSQLSPNDTPLQDKTFKDQLDEAAQSGPEPVKTQESLVEKVASYVPGMSGLTKSMTEEDSEKETDEDPQVDTSQLRRPDHDLHVEEFLKEQYKSKRGSGIPNAGEDS